MVTGQGGRRGEKLRPAFPDTTMTFCQASHDIWPANADLLHLLFVFVLASAGIVIYSFCSMSASHLVVGGVVTVGEPDASRLLYEEHVGDLVP